MKKMTTLMMAVLLMFGTLGLSVSAASMIQKTNDKDLAETGGTIIFFKNGDADGDNKISILDATLIQRVLVSLSKDNDGMITLRGDVNEDGLNILDATSIQRVLAGFNDPYKIGKDKSVNKSGSVELPEVPIDL